MPPEPRYRCSVAIPVLNGVVLVALFLHWFSYEVFSDRFSGLQLLFSAELFREESLSAFERLVNWGSLAAWLTVFTVAASAILVRSAPRKWLHGTAVIGAVALTLAATVTALAIADGGPGPGGSGEFAVGEGMDLLPWSLIMLAIAWVVRLADEP